MKQCIDPECIPPGALQAYVDGEDVPEVRAHLRRCADCAAEVQTLREMSAWLRGTLLRHECPPPERLALYQMRLLSAAEQLQLAAHVRQCNACQQELAEFAAAPETPPVWAWLQQAYQVVEAARLPQPASGVLRGPTGTPLQRFATPEVEIHLSVQPGLEAGQRMLLGRLTAQPGMEVVVTGLEVWLLQEEQSWAALVEAGGLFTFEGLEPGTYQLAVPLLDQVIKISEVEVA